MSDARPNVLFLFTDQQRPDYLGSNPEVPVRTPNLDALSERGVRFSDAVCPSPVCNPSRACLASGMEYDRCGVPGNHVDYPTEWDTYVGRLRDEAGYHTMGCGKFDLASGFPLGLEGDDGVEAYGFSAARFNPAKNNTVIRIEESEDGAPCDPYTQYLAEQGLLETHVSDYQRRRSETGGEGVESMWTATFPTPLPEEAYYDEWITRQGLSLLDGAPRDDPWFLQINFQNPHHPWDITESMHEWYRDPPIEFPPPVHSDLDVDAETHQEVRRNYAAMVEHLDDCVGRFLDALEARGEFEETIVIFSSDHGEMLGDYGQWQKLSPLQMSIGVPLVVAGPGIDPRDPCPDPVTILDLHATVLESAGLDPGDVDSRSMWPYLAGEGDLPREVVHSGLSAWRLVYDGRYKLIEGYDPAKRVGDTFEPMEIGPEERARLLEERERILYDVTENEHENVIDAHPDVHDRLAAALPARPTR